MARKQWENFQEILQQNVENMTTNIALSSFSVPCGMILLNLLEIDFRKGEQSHQELKHHIQNIRSDPQKWAKVILETTRIP